MRTVHCDLCDILVTETEINTLYRFPSREFRVCDDCIARLKEKSGFLPGENIVVKTGE